MTIRKVEKRFIDVRNPEHTIKKREWLPEEKMVESLTEVVESIKKYLKEKNAHPYQPDDYDLESSITILESIIDSQKRKIPKDLDKW